MKRRTNGNRSRRKARILSQFLFLLSAFTVGMAAIMLYVGYQFMQSEFPDVSVLRSSYPVVEYHPGAELPQIRIQHVRPAGWVGADEVSNVALGAIIVSEDWAFYQHKGYDANQIKEAIETDFMRGGFARGASTITQQVVRNVFLDKDKNLWRKVKELILSVRLERAVGKTRILETYLNIAEWGDGIFGIGAASRLYFNKSPSQLTAKEGAFLAMLLPSPKKYSQSFRKRELTDYARQTVDSILDKMTRAQYITEQERDRQLALPLPFEKPSSNSL